MAWLQRKEIIVLKKAANLQMEQECTLLRREAEKRLSKLKKLASLTRCVPAQTPSVSQPLQTASHVNPLELGPGLDSRARSAIRMLGSWRHREKQAECS